MILQEIDMGIFLTQNILNLSLKVGDVAKTLNDNFERNQKSIYRRSQDNTNSIDTFLGMVRFQNSTKHPKFTNLVQFF